MTGNRAFRQLHEEPANRIMVALQHPVAHTCLLDVYEKGRQEIYAAPWLPEIERFNDSVSSAVQEHIAADTEYRPLPYDRGSR
jgi:hypothetical protein